MSEYVLKKEKVPLTTKNRLFIEQNAYRRAQEYYEQLKNNNQFRDKDLRHRNAELVKRKQNLILMKGSLPSTNETQQKKMEKQKIKSENEAIQNFITKIRSQIQQYNELYDQLDLEFQNQFFSYQKLEQLSLDHSYTAEQLKNIHLKAIKKYEKAYQKENDLIHLIYSLQNREKKALKKERALDLILSEPIDNIELDELLTKDVEDSLFDLESREQSLDDTKLVNDVEKELVELEILFRKNQKRQKTLSVKKNSLESQSSFSSSSDNQSKRVVVQEKNLTILSPKDKAKINQKIENIIQNLNEKNRKCLDESLEIDQASIVNLKKNKEQEKQFHIKTLKIKNLEDQIDFTSDLKSSVQNEQNQILLLTRKLHDLSVEKEQIKHSNANASQSRKVFESRKEDLKKLRSLIDIKMKELEEKDLKISKRKTQLQKDQEYINLKMIELDRYEQNVQFLEDQARVYEDKIKENCHEINQSYSIIGQKAKLDLNSDRFLQSDPLS